MKSLIQLVGIVFLLTLPVSGIAQSPGSGNAYDFNSNYITIPNSASLNSDFVSLEAWIKADSWANNIWENVIISKDGWASGSQGYTLRAGANGSLSFNIGSSGSWIEVTSSPVMSTGQWYHVAGTFDGTILRLYINGEEVNTTSYSGVIDQGTYDVYLGRIAYTAGGSRYFDGVIDEARVWTTALPQSSIKDYMCQKVTASHPEYASLGGYWNLDDAGSVIDMSANGNNGTVNGATQLASGAPIGDESLHTYGSPVDMTLAWGSTDSVRVESSSAVESIHLYRVDMTANTTTAQSAITLMDDSHYYGVFVGASGAYNYDLSYYYAGNSISAGNEQYLNLAGRTDGSGVVWLSQGATVNQPSSIVQKSFSNRTEVMLAAICPSIVLNVTGIQSICSGDTLSISDQVVNENYQWHDAGGPISGETMASLDVWVAGDYYLVANDGICTDTSATVNVSVSPYPTVDFGTVGTTFCETDSEVSLTGGSPSGGAYTGTGVVSGSSFSPVNAGPGMHTLYYEYTNAGGCSSTDSVEVTVNAQPGQPIITTTVLADGTFELCSNSCGTGAIIEWFQNGTSLSTGTDTCMTASENGNYSVSCTYLGCSSDTSMITLSDVGLDGIEEGAVLSIAPNPVDDFVYINFTEEVLSETKLLLLDASGRVLLEKSGVKSSVVLDLRDYDTGVYFVIVNFGDQEIRRKIIKK